MSDYVRESGIIYKLGSIEQMEEFSKEKLGSDDLWADSYPEQLAVEESDKYIIANGAFWEIKDYKKLETEYDFCDLTLVEDGVRFHAMYYNGGTCLSEMIQEAMSKNKLNINNK